MLLGKRLSLRPALSLALFAWHTILGYYFSSYTLQYGGDAFLYYQKARFDYVEPTLGTDFVVWLSSFPVSIGFTYWPLTFMYNVAGSIGLLFFCAALEEISPLGSSGVSRILALLCAFIPSLSFWTSGIGKDSIAFLSVGMFLWSSLSFGRRQIAAMLAVLLMLTIRPHIACLMVLSVAAGTLFVSNVRGTVRFGIGAISTAAATFAVPLALFYSGTTRFSSLRDFIADRQEQNMGGGSSIDISSMNPMLRLFSFLYRPLPNEAAGIVQFAASLENLLLIILTVMGLVAIYRAGPVRIFRTYSIPLFYALACLLLLSQVTANLGLAARQKWMALPALIMIFASAWSWIVKDNPRLQRQVLNPRVPRAVP